MDIDKLDRNCKQMEFAIRCIEDAIWALEEMDMNVPCITNNRIQLSLIKGSIVDVVDMVAEGEPYMDSNANELLGLNKDVTESEAILLRNKFGRDEEGGQKMTVYSDSTPRFSVLSQLNDNFGYTFKDIGIFIREMGWDSE